MKAVFLDYDTVSDGDLDMSGLSAAVDDLRLVSSSATGLPERIRDADVVLLNKLVFPRELMQRSPKLKLLAVAGTGTNNIDLVAGTGTRDRRVQCARLLHRLGGAARVGTDLEPHPARVRIFAAVD